MNIICISRKIIIYTQFIHKWTVFHMFGRLPIPIEVTISPTSPTNRVLQREDKSIP